MQRIRVCLTLTLHLVTHRSRRERIGPTGLRQRPCDPRKHTWRDQAAGSEVSKADTGHPGARRTSTRCTVV